MNRREFVTALAGLGIARNAFGAIQTPTNLLRAPYLQNTQSGSTSILWASQGSSQALVEYVAEGSGVQQTYASPRTFPPSEMGMPGFTQYQVDLSDLAPDTQYSYRVIMDGEETARAHFRTAGQGPFKFVAIGDSGQGTESQRLLAQRIAQEHPSFLLHAGDMAYFGGTQAECQWNHFEIYKDLFSTIPLFPCPGNHEYMAANANPYVAIHSVPQSNVPEGDRGRYYSFDWGSVHFVCIDSNTPLIQAVNTGGEMLRWLEADLKATRQFWRVAIVHHPPYGGGPNQNDLEVQLVRQHVVPILETYGVQLVLSGHEHSYQRTAPIRKGTISPPDSGTVYVITGGGGAALYHTSPHPLQAVALSEHHYLSVEVNGMQMNVRAIGTDGREIDAFSLRPRPALSLDGLPAVSLIQSEAGTFVEIRGSSLAGAERSVFARPLPMELDGTSVTIDGSPMPLLYVSNTQVWGETETTLRPPFLLEVKTPNGGADLVVREEDIKSPQTLRSPSSPTRSGSKTPVRGLELLPDLNVDQIQE